MGLQGRVEKLFFVLKNGSLLFSLPYVFLSCCKHLSALGALYGVLFSVLSFCKNLLNIYF